MVYVEPAFPRGKAINTDGQNVVKRTFVKHMKYGASTAEDAKPRQLRPKERLRNLLGEKNKEEEAQELAFNANNLSQYTIQEGMLVLGCVRRVLQMYLEISLPGRLYGRLPISAISDAYSKRLQQMVQGEAAYCPTLEDLYRVGDLVYVKVMCMSLNPMKIELSLKPADLHSEFAPNQVVPGLVLAAAIAAEEDHGYFMETGIRHVRGFLPRESIRGNPADIGRNLFCSVEKVLQLDGKGATLILKSFRMKDRRTLNVNMVNLDMIVPGCVIPFTVGAPLENGLRGTLFDDTVCAYVNQNMLAQTTSKPEGYSLFKQLDATLLYVIPVTKQVFVSLVNYRNNRVEQEPETTLLPRAVIEKAQVTSVANSGVWFSFGECRALMPKNVIKHGLGNKGNYEDTINLGKYQVGTVHKLSVVRYDALDRTYVVCDDVDNALDELQTPMDVQIGETYRCAIKEPHKTGGLIVMLGNLTGLVPKLFLESNASTKMGRTVPMKAIENDLDSSASQHNHYVVKFTNRTEFMRSSAKILSNWNQLVTIGGQQSFDGVVVDVRADYYLVAFFNGIKGILYKNTVGVVQNTAEMNRLQCGTIARFTVHKANKLTQKLLLCLPLTEVERTVEICQATVTAIRPTGVDVRLQQDTEGTEGTIPLECFSAFSEHNSLFVKLLKEGSQVQVVQLKPGTYSTRDVRYFQYKPFLISRVRCGEALRASCFTRGGRLHAYLLLSDYTEPFPVPVNEGAGNVEQIPEGEIIMMKVESISTVKGKGCELKVSSTLRDVCAMGVESVYAYMVDYLEDVIKLVGRYQQSGQAFANYNIGQKVVCTIVVLSDDTEEMVVAVDDDSQSTSKSAKGIAMKAKVELNGPSVSYKVGDTLEGRVVWLDVEREQLVVCVDPALLPCIGEHDTGGSVELRGDQKVRGSWVLFKNNYIRVCCLKKGKPSPLVLVPVRHHYNDLFAKDTSQDALPVFLLKPLGPLVFGMHTKAYKMYDSYDKKRFPDGHEDTDGPIKKELSLRSKGSLGHVQMLPRAFKEPILDDEMAEKSDSEQEQASDGSASGDDDDAESYRDSVDDDEDEDYVFEDEFEPEEETDPVEAKKMIPVAMGSGVRKQKQKQKRTPSETAGKSVTKKAKNSSATNIRLQKDKGDKKALKKNQNKKSLSPSRLVSTSNGEKPKKLNKRKQGESVEPPPFSIKKKKLNDAKKKKISMLHAPVTEEQNGNKSKKGKRKQAATAPDRTGQAAKKKKQPPFVIDQLDGCGNDFFLCQLDGAEEEVPSKKQKKNTLKRAHDGQASKGLPGATNFWDSTPVYKRPESDSSEEEEDGNADDELQQVATKKRLTAKERFETLKQEEERLRKIEQELADPSVDPHTPDQFDRLVLAQPNSSLMWIRYMVFHMESAELDKARAVARKALKAINFREEAELLNVWVALLNLEIRYETVASFKEVLQEAIQYNDAFKVYSRVMDILIDCQKHTEVRELLELLQKKFRKQNDMWHLVADAWYRIGHGGKVKPLLSQALKSLPNRDHIPLIVKFAFLHNRNENRDEAHLLFEQILTSYPKRTDIWSQYVDMLVKDGLVANARQILERAIVQRLPMKNMKTLYTKYVHFEEKHGDRDSVRRVKQMATDYVQTQLNNAGVR